MIRKFRRPARREIITASALLAVLSIALLTEPRSLLSKYQSNEHGTDIQVVNAGHGERGQIYGAITGQDEMISVYYNQMPSELFEPGAEQKTPLKPAPTSSADTEQRTAEMKPAPTRPSDTEQKTPLKPTPTSSADMGSNSGSGGEISDGLQQPEIQFPEVLANPRPDYTEEARAARIEGFIVLKVMVRKDGGVDVISVERGLGYGIDEAAIDVITTRWRFRPATQDGVPIDHPAVIEVSFQLY